MTSATSTSWEKELRKNICTNFGRGIRVNGENSGRTKILYVYNEGLGSANKRTSQTLPIEWKKTSGIEINLQEEDHPGSMGLRLFLHKLCSRKKIFTMINNIQRL